MIDLAECSSFGIDGCPGGWFVVGCGRLGWAYGIVGRLDELVERAPRAQVLIDIPIGLPHVKRPTRRCEVEARAMLGPRRSSVFNVPCREALAAGDYAEASAINHQILGRKLSKQAWAIAPKIREVDDLLRLRPELRGRIRDRSDSHWLVRQRALVRGQCCR